MQYTKEEIAKRLGTLEDFHAFIAEHRKAFAAGDVDLNANFVLLGRFWLVGRNNRVHRLAGDDGKPLFPDDVVATLDPVLTQTEFCDVLKQHNRKQEWSGGDPCLPPLCARCPCCGQGWTIANCHDAHSEEGFEYQSFDEFVGQPLREVKAILEKSAQQGGLLFNLRSDVWGCKTDERGCKEERQCSVQPTFAQDEKEYQEEEDALWEYVVQPGDSGAAWVTTYYHGDCHKQLLDNRDDADFNKMLMEVPAILEREAGFTDVTLEEFVPDEIFLQRLRDWMNTMDGEDDEEDNERFLQAYRWIKVRTGEGTFRIGSLSPQQDSSGDFPQLVDLSDCGLTYADLLSVLGASEDMRAKDFQEMIAQMPAPMLKSPICSLVIDPQFFQNLRHLLQKKA